MSWVDVTLQGHGFQEAIVQLDEIEPTGVLCVSA
jgi:hypothetical protein